MKHFLEILNSKEVVLEYKNELVANKIHQICRVDSFADEDGRQNFYFTVRPLECNQRFVPFNFIPPPEIATPVKLAILRYLLEIPGMNILIRQSESESYMFDCGLSK